MRAIIIKDEDARNLLDQLELKNFQLGHNGVTVLDRLDVPSDDQKMVLDEIHRKFHFVVCRWLQDQGASVVR